jgi:hypothetical protein
MEVMAKRSPLKNNPRRTAGQSVQEQIEKLENDILEKVSFAALAVALLGLELFRRFVKSPPNPIGAAIICVPLLFYCIFRISQLRPRIRRLKQGRDGERIVGEQLETLRVDGYLVFHDLIGGDFNVDHVIVGPAGIFTVETKTASKAKGEKIESDGESIWKGKFKLKPNPIDQAKSQARWLYKLVKELTNENVFVQPIVVFPGWWVECKVREPQVLVLNPDQLTGQLKSLPQRLEERHIRFIANRLELLVRQK